MLFYDRVLTAASPAVTPYLLGHVLAHEIVHMLQGVEEHSSSGMMKPRWDNRDYADMQRTHLTLHEGRSGSDRSWPGTEGFQDGAGRMTGRV